jgi:hypothetical protein
MRNLKNHRILAFCTKPMHVLLPVLMMGISPAKSQEVMTLHRINQAVILDGIPDEDFWQDIPPLPMIMFMPTSGNLPIFDSDIRIC